MKSRFKIPVILFCLLLTSNTCWSEETLARLSFWIDPAQQADFETVYTQKIVPLLKTHGLNPTSKQGRNVPDSIFSRLLQAESLSQLLRTRNALEKDATWSQLLRELGNIFSSK